MDRRNELRFQIYTSAKIAPFDEPERGLDAQMVDVSASGVRFHTDAELLEDQIITIETDQHLILADVRNCKSRGIRFSVGAERVHTVAKFTLPRTESKAARNQSLVADYYRRLQDELEKPVAPGPQRSKGAACLALEQWPLAAVVAMTRASKDQPSTDAVAKAVSHDSSSPWKGRLTFLLSILSVAIVLVSLPGLSGHHVSASPKLASTEAAPEPALVVDSVVPRTGQTRAGHAVITLDAHGRSWATICAGNRIVYSKLLEAGQRDTLTFTERALVRLGNAAQVDLHWNGTVLGVLGMEGQSRTVELTPGSSRILADGEYIGCSQAQ